MPILQDPQNTGMHPQAHPQYLAGVPWPLWWQAAQERKSRRRVRAPATIQKPVQGIPGAPHPSSPAGAPQSSHSPRTGSPVSSSWKPVTSVPQDAHSFLSQRCSPWPSLGSCRSPQHTVVCRTFWTAPCLPSPSGSQQSTVSADKTEPSRLRCLWRCASGCTRPGACRSLGRGDQAAPRPPSAAPHLRASAA